MDDLTQLDDGSIAMVYRKNRRKIELNLYVFVPQHGISLTWVKPEHVPQLEVKRAGCCGGAQQMYRRATPQEARLWKTGQAR